MLCLLKMQLLEAICWIAAVLWKLSAATTQHRDPQAHCPSHTGPFPPTPVTSSPKEACRTQSLVWGPHHSSPTISYKKMHLVHNILGFKHLRHPRIWCYYSVIGWRDLHRATQSILLPGAEQSWTHHSGDTISFKNLEWRKWMKSMTAAHSCPFVTGWPIMWNVSMFYLVVQKLVNTSRDTSHKASRKTLGV